MAAIFFRNLNQKISKLQTKLMGEHASLPWPREHSSGKENAGLISPGRFGGRCPWHVEKVANEGCLGRCPARMWLPWDVFFDKFLGGQKSWLKR